MASEYDQIHAGGVGNAMNLAGGIAHGREAAIGRHAEVRTALGHTLGSVIHGLLLEGRHLRREVAGQADGTETAVDVLDRLDHVNDRHLRVGRRRGARPIDDLRALVGEIDGDEDVLVVAHVRASFPTAAIICPDALCGHDRGQGPVRSGLPSRPLLPFNRASLRWSLRLTAHQDSPFSRLPGVDALLSAPAAARLVSDWGRPLVLEEARATLDALRAEIAAGAVPDLSLDAVLDRIDGALRTRAPVGPVPVLNLTGTVIHTNLGRAPLAETARAAMTAAAGASNVEFDLAKGSRGERDDHVEALLCALTGAEAATVVNNCAAAVLLVLNTFALGREVPVSRGELVEIGGAFRMPEVMHRAGARLVEVGTTNRTHPRDYENAIGPETGMLMKVHPSNYEVAGFTQEVDIETLAGIARRHALPLAWDLGSGALLDGSRYGLPRELLPQDGLRGGADLVLFSGDKLLGGPQCGIVVGSRTHIEALRRNPMKRALRVDKIILAALAATLRLWGDPERAAEELPAFRLLVREEAEIRASAEDLAPAIGNRLGDAWSVEVVSVSSQIGSGAQPVERLPSAALAIRSKADRASELEGLAARLRATPLPVIGRIRDGALLLDCRTLVNPEALLAQFDALAHS